ncbi:hypothetical protein Hanom_Chr15g01360801 [Helianthus anomalus]
MWKNNTITNNNINHGYHDLGDFCVFQFVFSSSPLLSSYKFNMFRYEAFLINKPNSSQHKFACFALFQVTYR